jgi:hypothetical protein
MGVQVKVEDYEKGKPCFLTLADVVLRGSSNFGAGCNPGLAFSPLRQSALVSTL